MKKYRFFLNKHLRNKKHHLFIGVLTPFQGIGMMFSCDDTISTLNYISLEFRLFWLKIWYRYDI